MAPAHMLAYLLTYLLTYLVEARAQVHFLRAEGTAVAVATILQYMTVPSLLPTQ